MEIKTIVSEFFAANCYILSFDDFAIVIDPCISYKQIKKAIGDKELKALLLTHGHADHFSYSEEIKKHEDVKIYCHKEAKEKLEDENKNYSVMANIKIKYFFDNDEFIYIHEGVFKIANVNIKVIETPGHTNCSVIYIIEDKMFTGDTLFYRTVGRTDLYSSNSMHMNESLRKLKNLNKDYLVLPGHGQETSLSEEIKNNPYIKRLN